MGEGRARSRRVGGERACARLAFAEAGRGLVVSNLQSVGSNQGRLAAKERRELKEQDLYSLRSFAAKGSRYGVDLGGAADAATRMLLPTRRVPKKRDAKPIRLSLNHYLPTI